MHKGVTRDLGGKQGGVKCNPHCVDIQFFKMFFFVISLPRVQTRYLEHLHNFFTNRRRSMVIAFLGGYPPNILASAPNIPQKPHFGGPFNAKPTIERALR